MTPFEFIFSALCVAGGVIGATALDSKPGWRLFCAALICGMTFFAAYKFGLAART